MVGMNDDASQLDYWNQAAASKTFMHPLNIALLLEYVVHDACVVDYGCGYGRLCAKLHDAGFTRLLGVDFSEAMIARARQAVPEAAFDVIRDTRLALPDRSVDAVLLFAVLTCVPARAAQQAIVDELSRVLRPGGIVYLSDYPLQCDERNIERYKKHATSDDGYGVFTTDDGAVVRHHASGWFDDVFRGFKRESNADVEVVTMNGHSSTGYQAIFRKIAVGHQ
jgi:SAM-dependent methyltransferase